MGFSVASIIALLNVLARAVTAVVEKLKQSQLIDAGRAAERADVNEAEVERLNDATEVLAQHEEKKDVSNRLRRGDF